MEQIKFFIALLIVCFSISVGYTQINPKNDTIVENQQKILTIPFQLINGWILINGTIDNENGLFLFDTGSDAELIVNSNYFKDKSTIKEGKGEVRSGQNFSVKWIHIDSLVCFDFRLQNINAVAIDLSAPEMPESIMGNRLMGFIGYNIIKDYEFLIDYEQQIIKFFPTDNNGYRLDTSIIFSTKYSIPFEIMGNLPITNATINGKKYKLSFDTGVSYGSINEQILPSICKNNITEIKSDYLTGEYNYRGRLFWINNIYINDNAFNIPMFVNKENSKMSDIDIIIGYHFLKQYKTLWNFKKKTICIVK